MNGKIELLDSNILIYLSKRELSIEKVIKPQTNYVISIITYMEVFGYPFNNQDEEDFLSKLCSRFEVIDVTMPIAERVILLRKKKQMKLADAILAATALLHGWNFVTRNVEDFKNVPGLKLRNPFQDF